MDYVVTLLTDAAPYVHFIAFGLLILAGLNIPVSEDLVFIVSASLAATVVPENTVYVFIGCVTGAYISDILAYTLGRYGGNWIATLPLFKQEFSPARIARVKRYFDRYGIKTLFFGRFIPFGVRNVLFMTSGLVKVPFPRFLLVDLMALALTSSILFGLGYVFGSNYQAMLPWLDSYKILIFLIFLLAIAMFLYRRRKNKTKVNTA